MTAVQKTSFVPLAPVQLVQSNGRVRPFGYGATTAAARGTALLAAVNALTSGDRVYFGNGQYDLSTFLTIPANCALIGPGDGGYLYFNNLSYAIKVSGDQLGLYNFRLKSEGATGNGITFTATTTNFLFSGLNLTVNRDALVTLGGTAVLMTGVVRDTHILQGVAPGDLQVDLENVNGSLVIFENVDVESDNDAAVHWYGGTGSMYWRGGRIHGTTSYHFAQGDSAVIYVDSATEYDSTKVDGTVTRLPAYGVTPTTAGLALLDDANAAAQRTTLGLGTIATQAASSVAITGGSITGITDLAVADGGTGASTAANARTNLGLGTIATQDANNVSVSGGSVAGITDLAVADGGTGASTAANARTNLGLGSIATQAASSVAITGGSVQGLTYLAADLSSLDYATITNSNIGTGNVVNAGAITAGTLIVANGGTGATTLTGLIKGNGTSAFSAATAGTDYYKSGATTSPGQLIQCGGGAFAPGDATTLYWGGPGGGATNTAGQRRVYFPVAGTITKAYSTFAHVSTLGTNETSTLSIRLNNTTDTTISSAVTNDASVTTFNNTSLSIAIAAGDYIEIKCVTPTWATNPASVTPFVSLEFHP